MNPNVKIGFNWINNNDDIGTDPSIAVDDITLSGSGVQINENIILQSAISLFPNPFSSSATLQLSKPLQSATIVIADLLGKEVKQMQNVTGKEVIIQKENINSGIYFLKVTDISGLIETTKIIIE